MKQFMKRNDVSKKLDEVQKENEEGLLGDLASAGKKLAKSMLSHKLGY